MKTLRCAALTVLFLGIATVAVAAEPGDLSVNIDGVGML